MPTTWNEPADWDMFTTPCWEKLVPFARHVQRQPISHESPAFPQFLDLPMELQLHILAMCDDATLFSLMHVSDTIRKEAKKLFWSNPDVWYTVDAFWLESGGFAGCTHYTLDALQYMQRIVVRLDEWRPQFDRNEEDFTLEEHVLRNDSAFWRTLRLRFPRATHVVLSSDNCKSLAFDGLWGLQMLTKACPPDLSAYFSSLERVSPVRAERQLWRFAHSTHEWDLITPSWELEMILPPLKGFTGQVGAFCRIKYDMERLHQRVDAQHLFFFKIAEAHHAQQGETFTCFYPECIATFSVAGEWTKHFFDVGHRNWRRVFNAAIPAGLRALMIQFEQDLEQRSFERTRRIVQMREIYNQDPEASKKAFLSQLESDSLYVQGKPAAASAIWKSYLKYTSQHSNIEIIRRKRGRK